MVQTYWLRTILWCILFNELVCSCWCSNQTHWLPFILKNANQDGVETELLETIFLAMMVALVVFLVFTFRFLVKEVLIKVWKFCCCRRFEKNEEDKQII